MATFENIIGDLGGMGRFQILQMLSTESCRCTMAWSMIQMSFARLVPDFHCLMENTNISLAHNDTSNVCSINGTQCSSFQFGESSRTAATEWHLMCDRDWIQQTIISAQMAGVLIGSLISGQLGDTIGRRKVVYAFHFLHIICNFIAAASTSWAMFCAMRFFIGICIGCVMVGCFPLTVEFLPVKWRPLLPILPTWAIGVSFFAATAVILDDWSYLHLACGIASIPALLGFFFVPESMRWLAMHGRVEDAQKVLAKIAKWNRREVAESTKHDLRQIADKAKRFENTQAIYSFLDIFKGWKQIKITVSMGLFWFILSVNYYGIYFGLASLHGNIFLNIFIFGAIEVPIAAMTFFTNNLFGRRRTVLFLFGMAFLSTGGCLLSHAFLSGWTKTISINVLSLIAKSMIGCAWSGVQLWGSELYPTVIRNLGYGFSASGARLGGMLAPFMIRLDKHMAMSYGILTCMNLIAIILCFGLSETKGKALQDTLYVKSKVEDIDEDMDNDI